MADPLNVGLFVTCLVDLMRPSVGFAAVRLLEAAGCTVTVPMAQTCCGQPTYNAGDSKNTRAIARQVIDAFDGFDYVVAPSGSCAGMIRVHYPQLFEDDAKLLMRAQALADRTYELTAFLVDVAKAVPAAAEYAATATYHDSCAGLRELGIKHQPRQLLRGVKGLRLAESDGAEACCGFGGLFCVKYPGISEHMLDERMDQIAATGADTLLGGDMGCLMNMAGRFKRQGSPVRVRHVAEVLAGMTDDVPPIGDGD